MRRTATERHIARTSRASGAWSRSTGSASDSLHRSCWLREDRSSQASIGYWVVRGTRADWHGGRRCLTIRSCEPAAVPELCAGGSVPHDQGTRNR